MTTRPAPFTSFTHFDGTTELSRDIASLGIYPAVDPLASTSTILTPEVVGDRHYNVARRVQSTSTVQELQDIIAILGLDELSEEDRVTVDRAQQVERFLSQPMFVTEVFTGQPGVFTSIDDTVSSFEALVQGDLDHLPEQAFYMVGGAEEVEEKLLNSSQTPNDISHDWINTNVIANRASFTGEVVFEGDAELVIARTSDGEIGFQ